MPNKIQELKDKIEQFECEKEMLDDFIIFAKFKIEELLKNDTG